MNEGVQLVEERENDAAEKLRGLKAAVQLGIDAIDRGDYVAYSNMDALTAGLTKVADEAIADTVGR